MSVTTRSGSAKKQGKLRRQKLALSVIVCLFILVTVFCTYCITRLSYKKVYEGVNINNVSVAGLTREELCAKIPEIFDKPLSKRITLDIDGTTHEFESLSIVPVIDVDKMVDEAFSYGRTRKFLARLSEISSVKKNPVNVPFTLEFDDNALQKIINSATLSLNVTATPNKIEYGEDALIITKGTSGNGVEFNDVKSAVEACLLSDSTVAEVDFKHIEPEEITYDYIMRFVYEEPVNAEYSIENHRISFSDSAPGVSLSKGDLKDAIKEAEGNVIMVPAKIKQPDITSEQLRSEVVAHELGKFSTDYSSSSADRAYNIKLACEKINGYVLEPGEEFSYNEVVGPRTADRGFRIANVYVGNTVQPGIGGGICQVSSTMYNAIIFADLEITERRNHTLPVSYVPMGRDATVSYGSTDFRFKNNTEHPIEIRAIAENGTNTVIIMGTDTHPGREIKIETSRTSTSSPKVIIKKSAELLEGDVKIESSGSNGSSYAAYKVIYENGKEVSRDKLPNSTYAGKDRVEIHGTRKPEPEPKPEPTPEPYRNPEKYHIPESSGNGTVTSAPEPQPAPQQEAVPTPSDEGNSEF